MEENVKIFLMNMIHFTLFYLKRKERSSLILKALWIRRYSHPDQLLPVFDVFRIKFMIICAHSARVAVPAGSRI